MKIRNDLLNIIEDQVGDYIHHMTPEEDEVSEDYIKSLMGEFIALMLDLRLDRKGK